MGMLSGDMENLAKASERRPTLRDVAREANVSIATVSRVLNRSPHVSKKALAKVEAVIEKLGFSPSPAARALNTGRTKTVGALIPTLDNAIFSRFLDALEKRLSDHAHSLVISTTGDDPKTELSKATKLLEMGAEALVVSGEVRHSDFEPLIERYQIPVIVTSYFSENARYPSIGYDNAAISKIALDHLIDKGHKSIAVIHGPQINNDRTRSRLEGIQADQRFENITYHETELSIAGGVQGANDIVSAVSRPTAILCLSDVLALGALFEAKRHQLSVPDDVAIMGLDNLSWAEHSDPPLTSIELSVSKMGEHVADQICNFLDENKPLESILLQGELIARETT